MKAWTTAAALIALSLGVSGCTHGPTSEHKVVRVGPGTLGGAVEARVGDVIQLQPFVGARTDYRVGLAFDGPDRPDGLGLHLLRGNLSSPVWERADAREGRYALSTFLYVTAPGEWTVTLKLNTPETNAGKKEPATAAFKITVKKPEK